MENLKHQDGTIYAIGEDLKLLFEKHNLKSIKMNSDSIMGFQEDKFTVMGCIFESIHNN